MPPFQSIQEEVLGKLVLIQNTYSSYLKNKMKKNNLWGGRHFLLVATPLCSSNDLYFWGPMARLTFQQSVGQDCD
jgi:hypothetical protein